MKSLMINGEKFTTEGHRMIKNRATGLIPFYFNGNRNDTSFDRTLALENCISFIKSIASKRVTNEHQFTKIIRNTKISSKLNLLKSLQTQNNLTTWKNKVANWDISTKDFITYNNLCLANALPQLLSSIDHELHNYFNNCKYVAPIRAKAVRYYRRQNLSVLEVDANGDNLPMYLDNLTGKQKESYQTFIKSIFGFEPFIKTSEGHLAINIKNENGDEYNLTDLGYGYSQILPIITKLWHAYNIDEKSNYFHRHGKQIVTLLIEQPELHLHPAMQAQLADAFIQAINNAKENKITLKLIIETHSSTIINRFGRRISENSINEDDIGVTLFNHDISLNQSSIQTTKYNSNGVLEAWPIGFFEPNN